MLKESIVHDGDSEPAFHLEWDPPTRRFSVVFHDRFWQAEHSRRLPASDDVPNPPTLREADIDHIVMRLRQVSQQGPHGGSLPDAPTGPVMERDSIMERDGIGGPDVEQTEQAREPA